MRSCVVWLLLCSAGFSQFTATVETPLALTGITNPQQIGSLLLVGADSKPVVAPVGIVTVVTEAAQVRIKVYTEAGARVPHKTLVPKVFAVEQAGKFWATITCVDFDKKIFDEDELTFVVGPAPPPGPGPGPDPTPDALPIAGEGFRVLIVYESSTLTKLPPARRDILYAQEIRQYLDSKVAVVGTSREWRLLDQDTDMRNAAKVWQDAMLQPRLSIPWIYISNGKQGYSGPLPATIADTLDLLKKYGG